MDDHHDHDDHEDLDDLISSLTPRENNEAIKSYQNTTAIACPACADPFDDLVVCKQDLTSLELDVAMDLCTTQHEGNVLLFTHKH